MELIMILPLTFCLTIAGTDAAITLTKYVGQTGNLECSYETGYEDYKKYLCRNSCSSWDLKDVPVQSGSSPKDSRFSLKDNTKAKVFTVTITDLDPKDEGTYWCVIERVGVDKYTEFKLLVKEGVPTTTIDSQSTYTNSSERAEKTNLTKGMPGYIIIGAGAALFAVAVIIAIYCKRNRRGSETVAQTTKIKEDCEDD